MVANFKGKKNNSLRQISLVFGGILLLILIVLLTVANIRIYQKRQKFISQIENLENQIKQIKNENENLKQGIAEIGDIEYIEKVAREELSLQKPGEKVISFIKNQNQLSGNSEDKKNFLQNWVKWLNNWFKKLRN